MVRPPVSVGAVHDTDQGAVGLHLSSSRPWAPAANGEVESGRLAGDAEQCLGPHFNPYTAFSGSGMGLMTMLTVSVGGIDTRHRHVPPRAAACQSTKALRTRVRYS